MGSERVWGGFVMGVDWVRYWVAGGEFCHLRVIFEAFSNGFERFFAKMKDF